MKNILILAAALALSSCGDKGRIQMLSPPVADLAVEKKPVVPVEAVSDEVVAADYDSKLESWGERGWSAVGRLCRYFKTHGTAVDCPAPE